MPLEASESAEPSIDAASPWPAAVGLAAELDVAAGTTTDRVVRDVVRHVFEAMLPRRAVLTSGLGMEGCALIDILAPLELPLRVVFLDTGFHFAETLELLERLETRYPSFLFESVTPRQTPDEQAATEGPALWLRDSDRCCRLRKVEPLRRRLADADLWISAITRSQAATRGAQPVLTSASRFGVPKLSPLAHWDRAAVWGWVQAHDVPFNPLHLRSYPTIGCHHCTLPVAGAGPADYSREGRWSASGKTECGLHGRTPERDPVSHSETHPSGGSSEPAQSPAASADSR
ncbi:MAG: phosphoadenylyl-sulfate reductase [Acidobacteriota bacterium]